MFKIVLLTILAATSINLQVPKENKVIIEKKDPAVFTFRDDGFTIKAPEHIDDKIIIKPKYNFDYDYDLKENEYKFILLSNEKIYDL